MIFDSSTKTIQWGKDLLVNKWCWENWISVCKRIMFGLYLPPYPKSNWKWIIELYLRTKTVKLLEKNIEEKLHAIGFDGDFLGMIPEAQATKEVIDKLNYTKIKAFVYQATLLTEWKGNPFSLREVGVKHLRIVYLIRN